ncbi:hypothetical protein C8R44DRAFT_897261 [Mycena epipterygia]|nr:hypothetical protein C8R44DRAFT_897261 [Mycena epipterygia]
MKFLAKYNLVSQGVQVHCRCNTTQARSCGLEAQDGRMSSHQLRRRTRSTQTLLREILKLLPEAAFGPLSVLFSSSATQSVYCGALGCTLHASPASKKAAEVVFFLADPARYSRTRVVLPASAEASAPLTCSQTLQASPALHKMRPRKSRTFFFHVPSALFPDAGGAPRVRGAPTSPPIIVEGSAHLRTFGSRVFFWCAQRALTGRGWCSPRSQSSDFTARESRCPHLLKSVFFGAPRTPCSSRMWVVLPAFAELRPHRPRSSSLRAVHASFFTKSRHRRFGLHVEGGADEERKESGRRRPLVGGFGKQRKEERGVPRGQSHAPVPTKMTCGRSRCPTKTTCGWGPASTKASCRWGCTPTKPVYGGNCPPTKTPGIKRDGFPLGHTMRGVRLAAGAPLRHACHVWGAPLRDTHSTNQQGLRVKPALAGSILSCHMAATRPQPRCVVASGSRGSISGRVPARARLPSKFLLSCT